MTDKSTHANKFEIYSDELVNTSNTYHRLHVNLILIKYSLYHADELMKGMNSEIIRLGGEDDSCSIDPGDMIKEGIESLEVLMELTRVRFHSLLEKESEYQLSFSDKYPSIVNAPEWIRDLFPYDLSKYQKEKIKPTVKSSCGSIGGCIIHDDIPDSFIQVWWPVAANYASPGYLTKAENGWLSRGTES